MATKDMALANNTPVARPKWIDSSTVGQPVPAHVPKELFPFMPSADFNTEEADVSQNKGDSWSLISQQIQKKIEERHTQEKLAAQREAATAKKERAESAAALQCAATPSSFTEVLSANDEAESQIPDIQRALRPEFPATPFAPKEEQKLAQETQLRVKQPTLHPKPEPRPQLNPSAEPTLNPQPLPQKVLQHEDPQEKLRFFAEARRNLEMQPKKPAPVLVLNNSATNTFEFNFQHINSPSEIQILNDQEAKKELDQILANPNSKEAFFYNLNRDLFANKSIQFARVHGHPTFLLEEKHLPEVTGRLQEKKCKVMLDGQELGITMPKPEAPESRPAFAPQLTPPFAKLPPMPGSPSIDEENQNQNSNYQTPRPRGF